MENTVQRTEFVERKSNCDGRFARDKDRLDEIEGDVREMRKLTIVTNQLLQQHDESIKKQDARISALEGKSGKRWDSMVGKFFEWALVAVLGFLVAYFTKTP